MYPHLSEKTANRLLALIAISPIIRKFALPGIVGLMLFGVGLWQKILWLKIVGLLLAAPIFWVYFVLMFVYLPMALFDALRRSRRGAKSASRPQLVRGDATGFLRKRNAVILMDCARKNGFFSRLLISGALFLVACTAENDASLKDVQNSDAQPIGVGRPRKTFVHGCSDKTRFTARIEGEKAWLFLPSGTISLPQVPAASGAKYSDGATTFWSKGEEAVLERPDHARIQCVNNRAEAIWEDAKLRGADFRGRGNEPGWHVEISKSYGIVFVTNYGSDRYHFESFEMISDEASRTTTFEAKQKNGHELLITLEGRRCSDSMSGEQFETTVTVTLDGNKLNGCGRALH